jgi:hypothetical protein
MVSLPTDPVAYVLLAAVWVSFLWFPYLRTARTIVYLLVVSVGLVAAGFAPPPWPPIIRTLVLASVAAMHLRFSSLLSALPTAVSSFYDSYIAINKRLATAYADFEKTGERAPLERALGHGISDLELLHLPPGGDWQSLQRTAVGLLQRRLTMLKDGTDTHSGAAMRFRTQRAEIHRQLRDALQESKSFWR